MGCDLVFALKFYWIIAACSTLGIRITVEAFERSGARTAKDYLTMSRSLVMLASSAAYMGRYAEAKIICMKACDSSRNRRQALAIAGCASALRHGLPWEASQSAQRDFILWKQFSCARRTRQQASVAAALNALAQFHRVETSRSFAVATIRTRLLNSHESLGDQESIAIGLLNLVDGFDWPRISKS